ncbi:MAG: NAD(P)-dependent oxidoreductase [Deinococcales bacterium]
MKIIIFGASGRTGQHLVNQALEIGHEVSAVVRDSSKLQLQHPRLSVVKASLEQPLEPVIRGSDAVLSALGPTKGGSKTIMRTAAKSIVTAMQKSGVKRLITLTGAGVAQPGDQPKAFNHLMSFMLNLFAKDVLIDSSEHAAIVRASGLAYTIVRVPVLTDAAASKHIRVGMVGINDGARISRADVATYMLQQLEDSSQIGQAPVISG